MEAPNIQIKKILYATDLSDTAIHAFSYAVSLANMYGAGITFLHVLTEFPGEHFISNMISTDTWAAIKEKHYSDAREDLIGKKKDRQAIRDVIRAFSEEVKANNQGRDFVTDEIIIKPGPPAEVIVETAKEQSCDLIVMGTHGQGVIANVLIGSTAKSVVKQSPIPVLIIRLP
jgi:nucleotide-binding universal stress UspA family protein